MNRYRQQPQHGRTGPYQPERSARVRLQRRSATAAQSKILVKLPNGETRQMEAGPSSVITKAIVEVFALRFLGDPAVLWISESGNKVIQRDEALAQSLGLKIEADKLLPDTILVDLASGRTARGIRRGCRNRRRDQGGAAQRSDRTN